MTETSEKYIEVAINPDDFKTGELVKVLMKQSLGLRATLLAYVLPFMIVLIGINGINLPGNAGSICRIIIPGYALRLFCFIAFLQRQITEDLSIYIE
jgi:positive regulator of sigma E activity